MLTLITPAPMRSIYETNKHWCTLGGARGCSIFMETSVKRLSNPWPLQVSIAFNSAQHIFSPAKLFQNTYDFTKCASFWHNSRGVIRVVKSGKIV